MTRGLLLLDVDGPLNPYNAKPHQRPEGYETFRRTPVGRWYSGRDVRRFKGLRVWLNPAHGPQLTELAAECDLQLVWATTWLHEANTRIGPAIGLPELPVIEFPDTDLDPVNGWRDTGAWKWNAVARFAAGRPLAWLDDEHGTAVNRPGRNVFDRARVGTSTLLCHVDPAHGLLPDHLTAVRTWAAALTEPASV